MVEPVTAPRMIHHVPEPETTSVTDIYLSFFWKVLTYIRPSRYLLMD